MKVDKKPAALRQQPTVGADLLVYIINKWRTIIDPHIGDPRIRAARYNTGFTSNPWLLECPETGEKFILKDVSHSEGYRDQDLFIHQRALANRYPFVTQALASLQANGQLFMLYEYNVRVRETTCEDTETVLINMLRASHEYGLPGQVKLVPGENYVPFIAANYLQAFNRTKLAKFVPYVSPEIMEVLCQLARYFILNPGFGGKHSNLPVGFIHREVKPANVIVTQTGPKLIDWDGARFDVRIKELAHFAILCLDGFDVSCCLVMLDQLVARVRSNGIDIRPVEEEMLPYYLLLVIVATNIWFAQNLEKMPPQARHQLSMVMLRHWGFLQEVIERNDLLDLRVRKLVS